MAEKVMSSAYRLALVLSTLLLTVGCDQATKALVRHALSSSDRFSFLDGAVILRHAENPGAFLSLGANLDASTRFWIFSVFVSFFLAFTLYKLIRSADADRLFTFGATLLIAGGVGNLIDRISKGTVTDFLVVSAGPLSTGVFNVADFAIVVGVAVLLYCTYREKVISA